MSVDAHRQHRFKGDLVCRWQEFPEDCGAYLCLDPTSDDPIVKSYLAGEPANSYMLNMLALTTAHDESVVDLGCHVGTFTLGALASGRSVIAVDANPFHVFLVDHAARLNGFNRLQLRWCAISRNAGTVRFREQGLFGAIDYGGGGAGTIEVATTRLDDLVGDSPKRVAFIKMDIEGAEHDAILGARQTLAAHGPVVLFESNPMTLHPAGSTVEKLRVAFEDVGYKVFRIEGERWVYASPDQIHPEAWVDMIALNAAEQSRFSSRIDWTWSEDAILQRCRDWAALPFANVKAHVLAEIEVKAPHLPRLAEQLGSVAKSLRSDPSWERA